MANIHTPIYDPLKTYYENFDEGPFGAFGADSTYEQTGKPTVNYLGNKLHSNFGFSSGPLISSRHVEAAFKSGFDLNFYKTVRIKEHPCNDYPNVLPARIEGETPMTYDSKTSVISIGEAPGDQYPEKLVVANSYGVPSFDPDFWQEDIKKAVESAGEGQMLIAPLQGTPDGQGRDSFIQQHIDATKLMLETGVKMIEINLSCPNDDPNSPSGELLCFDLNMCRDIADAVKNVAGNVPVVMKPTYFEDQTYLEKFIDTLAPIVDGFTLINTLGLKLVDTEGNSGFAGREFCGVSGEPILWAGVDMVKRFTKHRAENNLEFIINGVGGVSSKDSYQQYIDNGADAVFSAAAAMWNPYLAKEIME